MELWVALAVGAAFFQTLRSALQKRLTGTLSAWGATAARFVYAAPLAAALAAALAAGLAAGQGLPGAGPGFWGYVLGGGLAQIAATGLLIHLFAYRNFTVATGFTKTEPVLVAIFGAVLLGDRLSAAAAAAIAVSLAGAALISFPRGARLRLDRAALMGIAAGGLFGLSAVAYRGATLELTDGDLWLRATVALAAVTAFQATACLLWLRLREPGQARRLLAGWRSGMQVGLAGMLGSLGWFAAFTMENAAHVRAVGQVEVVFMIGASILMFGERPSRREISGVALIALGVVWMVLAA